MINILSTQSLKLETALLDVLSFLDYQYEPGGKETERKVWGWWNESGEHWRGMRKWIRQKERQKSPLRSSISRRDHHTSIPALQPTSDIISRLQHPLWNMLHPPPKSMNIDSAFEQACVSTQVGPNDFETASYPCSGEDAEAHLLTIPTKLKWMNTNESATKVAQFKAATGSVAILHKKPD